jgi:hypothetical protein
MLLVIAQPHCQIDKSDLSDLKLHHPACVSVCSFSGHIHAVFMAIFMQFLMTVDSTFVVVSQDDVPTVIVVHRLKLLRYGR